MTMVDREQAWSMVDVNFFAFLSEEEDGKGDRPGLVIVDYSGRCNKPAVCCIAAVITLGCGRADSIYRSKENV